MAKRFDLLSRAYRLIRPEKPVSESDEDFLICNDDRCVLLAEDFEADPDPSPLKNIPFDKFNTVIEDVAKVYPNAVLVGAVAAAKYIRNPVQPRETRDVDVLLDEKDFAEFLIDDIPDKKLKLLETYFENSDSSSHSMKHKETGIYIDFLSTESQPIRKKISRYILQNREKATHVLLGDTLPIDILKPELLIAMKINRYCKNPKTDRGVSDRLDIVKILQTLTRRRIPIGHDSVRSFLNPAEIKKYDEILREMGLDM